MKIYSCYFYQKKFIPIANVLLPFELAKFFNIITFQNIDTLRYFS